MVSKEYPWLFAPRSFLFGLIQVPQWGYDCGYSNAYIEIMCLDTTIIHYLDENDKKKSKSMDREDKAREAIQLYEKNKALKEKKAEEVTIKLK